MTRAQEIAWAAGLFEGEGCATTGTRSSGSRYAQAVLVSTDLDVLRRFHQIVGVGRVFGPYLKGSRLGKKPIWRWHASTREARQVLALLLPLLGKRRATRVKALLAVPVKTGNYLYRKEVRK